MKICRSNAGWREIDKRKIFFRSKWEYNYGCYLQFLKARKDIQDWEHEPKTFWFEAIKRGIRSYLPDYKVINLDLSHFWVEVKGYMDSKSNTKIKRFKKYYPDEEIIVIDGQWFKKNKILKGIIKGWE